MKISPAAAYQYYNSYKTAAGTEAPQKAQASAKTDTVSISGKATQSGAVARMTQEISSQLDKPASRAKIEALKAAVEKNEYNVPSEAIADSILGALGLDI
ncbi:MAG: flagellar biosynthesis anti-sigma factor FlgM [Hydrogenoanaerobacterium sp.]